MPHAGARDKVRSLLAIHMRIYTYVQIPQLAVELVVHLRGEAAAEGGGELPVMFLVWCSMVWFPLECRKGMVWLGMGSGASIG